MPRQRQKDERRERGAEGEKEEFEAVPSSIADALKDGRLNPTGVFEDQTFADIAALCSFMGNDEQKFYFKRQQEKYAARPDGDDKYRLPPTANCFTYAQMTGLWIKPCQFQTVVMDVLEQQPGCSGGWIQRSALHALQVSFEHVVKSTLGEARKSAANRKSAVVAGADVAAGAPDSGLTQSAPSTIDWAAVEKAAAAVAAPGGAAAGEQQQQQLSSTVHAFVEMAGCISASKSLVQADVIRDFIVDAARDHIGNVTISPGRADGPGCYGGRPPDDNDAGRRAAGFVTCCC